ncbi:hypothetical protein DFH94DRAFT_368282 [Russula ochroleuca]|uniref:Uncharacterized protein n=1 Tax=Russula ochroleuca TaxID=152965 RepID=A0A9P5TAN0_9AGAM|nr:hypothetical protein DFH94DRAFT_368282 [Russula ochroleuca]
MTCILPHSFFLVKAVHLFPAFGRTVYDSFLLLLTLRDRPCIASRCLLAAAALSYPSSKHFTSTGYITFRLHLNCFFWTLSSCHPVVPSFLFAWPIVSLSFPLFFCFPLVTSSAIFYHYSRTGYEDKRAMRRLFFAYFQRSDPGHTS